MGNGERRGRLTVSNQYDHGEFGRQMKMMRVSALQRKTAREEEEARQAAQSDKPEKEDGPAGLVDEGKIEE